MKSITRAIDSSLKYVTQLSQRSIVRAIDPSLKYVTQLRPSGTEVYKVERDGVAYVLKTNPLAYHAKDWGILHIRQEIDVLQAAEDVDGITHLVREYGEIGGRKVSLLKEFYNGTTLRSLGGFIKDTKLQKKLESVVRSLHSIGIANLDLNNNTNIIISPDASDVRIVDLGCGVFSNNVTERMFQGSVNMDMNALEFIFQQ